jgi:hypothetical protein
MWKEYGKERDEEWKYPLPGDSNGDSMGVAVIIILACIVAVGMYMVGKSDGISDTLKTNPLACQTAEILEDS